MEIEPQALITPEMVAKYVNIKTCTVYSWIKRGKFKAYKLGKKTFRTTIEDVVFSWEFNPTSKERFIEACNNWYDFYIAKNGPGLINQAQLKERLNNYAEKYISK